VCVQDMLSPKVVSPLSGRDKVLLQCGQRHPVHFDDFLADRYRTVRLVSHDYSVEERCIDVCSERS